MTPGTYLRLRRQAADRTLADVAAEFHTVPRTAERDRIALLELIETDATPITITAAAAYQRAGVELDVAVLVALVPPHPPMPPRLCRICACSEYDPCVDAFSGDSCHWIAADLCSACAGIAQPEAKAA